MDIFKIGEKLKRNVALHFSSFRRTGRTHHLLNSLRDGDLVVFAFHQHLLEVQRLLVDLNIKVNLIVISPFRFDGNDDQLRGHRGRVIFDHCWLEEYYAHSIEQASNVIRNISKTSFIDYEEQADEYFSQKQKSPQKIKQEDPANDYGIIWKEIQEYIHSGGFDKIK